MGLLDLFKIRDCDNSQNLDIEEVNNLLIEKEATRILMDHIDTLSEQFSNVHKPGFTIGEEVIVNAFSIGKPSGCPWEGGARELLRCLEAENGEEIRATITGYKVQKGLAIEQIESFMREYHEGTPVWQKLGKWVLYNKSELIRAFNEKLDRTASYRSSLTPFRCFYIDYSFKTKSKAKEEFSPQWGLSSSAFHKLKSREGKITQQLYEKHRKLEKLIKKKTKLENEISSTIKKSQQ